MSYSFDSFKQNGFHCCECSIPFTEFECSITPVSIKLECLNCHHIRFYRRVKDIK